MPLDHSKATVTVSVVGLAIACINRMKKDQCEIGMLRCDRHTPVLDIQKIRLDPESGEPINSCLFSHTLNLGEDIFINVKRPHARGDSHCAQGTSTYLRRGFDRLNDTGDNEDFRWIADLEGEEFHNRMLMIEQRSKLKPTIFVGEGILYTRQKTYESLARVPINGTESPVKPLGRFAYGMNIDITCPEGGELVLSNRPDIDPRDKSDDCSISLPQEDNVRYMVTIENHCNTADESEGTDFRLFYEALKDPTGKQFDLRRIVETGCHADPEEALEQIIDFSLDGFPERCPVVFVGRMTSLNSNTICNE